MLFPKSSLRRALCAAAFAVLALPSLHAQQADMILHNGKVLTVDANFSVAQALSLIHI